MIFIYLLGLSLILFAIGIAGISSSRHFIVMMFSVEIVLVAAALLAASVFSYLGIGSILLLLFTVWAVAAAEVVVAISLYQYMVKAEVSLDVSKLSKLRE
jgi:NADH-quinone oxidoreductase subunit K